MIPHAVIKIQHSQIKLNVLKRNRIKCFSRLFSLHTPSCHFQVGKKNSVRSVMSFIFEMEMLESKDVCIMEKM